MSETTRKVYECRRCGRVVEELLLGEPSDKKLFCDCYIGKGIISQEMHLLEVPTEMNREAASLEIVRKRHPRSD